LPAALPGLFEEKTTTAAQIQKKSGVFITIEDIRDMLIESHQPSRHLVFGLVVEIEIPIVGDDGSFIFFLPCKDKIAGWATVVNPAVKREFKVTDSLAIGAVEFFISSA